VLGRHVEDTFLMELARRGRELGCARLEIPVVRTERNVPLREFLGALAESVGSVAGEGSFSCAIGALFEHARDRQTPYGYSLTERSPQGLPSTGSQAAGGASRGAQAERSEVFQRIATELATAEGILAALRGVGQAPGDADLEARVTAIWRGILRADGFGPDDDFFDLGGDSLGAVEVLLEIHRQLGFDIPMTILFTDRFTVNRLRDLIEKGALEDSGALDWDAPVAF